MMTGQVITPEDLLTLGDTSDSKIIVKDDIFDESTLIALLNDVQKINAKDNLLSTAKMGSKNSLVDSHILRGDEICWVTPDLCKELGLSAMKLFVQTMIKMMKPFQQDLGLMPDYSLQYALYKGNASGYVKHLDFNKAQYISDGTIVRGRKLTAILYLNREWEGGQLRVHLPSGDPKQFFDIDPLLGRLVIFRSDHIEHEVLPCYKDRSALTFWISADHLMNTQVPSYIPLDIILYAKIHDIANIHNIANNDSDNSVSTLNASATVSASTSDAIAIANVPASTLNASATVTASTSTSTSANVTASTSTSANVTASTVASAIANTSASTIRSGAKENMINHGNDLQNDTINDNNKYIADKSDIVNSAVSKSPLSIPSHNPFSLPPEHWDGSTIFVRYIFMYLYIHIYIYMYIYIYLFIYVFFFFIVLRVTVTASVDRQ
jgi:SM-20-related protein